MQIINADRFLYDLCYPFPITPPHCSKPYPLPNDYLVHIEIRQQMANYETSLSLATCFMMNLPPMLNMSSIVFRSQTSIFPPGRSILNRQDANSGENRQNDADSMLQLWLLRRCRQATNFLLVYVRKVRQIHVRTGAHTHIHAAMVLAQCSDWSITDWQCVTSKSTTKTRSHAHRRQIDENRVYTRLVYTAIIRHRPTPWEATLTATEP